ncbi:MAG: single-strand DNA-binding protein [Parcubacteria group bacterium Athens0714_25]|nr:MAG: single-strand DNA-binding protein [Parcubacteria group bacterium Athens0714_25]
MNVNKVILVGRLTRDPELRTTTGGKTVASVSIATNSFWTDASGQKQKNTEFHNIVLFGRSAEICGQYLTKGQEAFFEGRLQTRTYTGKDGIERRTTEVVAENMQLGSRPQGSGGQEGGYSGGGNSFSTPKQQASAPVQRQSAPVQKPPVQDDNIPTINLDEEQEDVRIEDVPF